MPLLAILRHDLRTLWTSWLVRLWLAGAAVLTLLLVASNWALFQTAELVACLLFPFLVFPWFLVVIVLGVTPVSGSRAEALADGILSRPVTRWEYLVASWAARVVTVLGVFLAVIVPAVLVVALARRPVDEDAVTLYGILASLAVVGLVLTFLVSLGFLLGTLLRGTLLAVVVLVFVWYPISLILSVFSLEEFSPISLNQAIPTLLRQPWSTPEAEVAEEPAKEDARQEAAKEDPQETAAKYDLQRAADDMSNFPSFFTQGPPKPKPKPKPEPKPKPGFFQREEFEDFSLTRVVLGYGLPTLAAIGLATLCFCRRDL